MVTLCMRLMAILFIFSLFYTVCKYNQSILSILNTLSDTKSILNHIPCILNLKSYTYVQFCRTTVFILDLKRCYASELESLQFFQILRSCIELVRINHFARRNNCDRDKQIDTIEFNIS